MKASLHYAANCVELLSPEPYESVMTYKVSELADLGWQTFYASQLSEEERATLTPVKVMEVHRSSLRVLGLDFDQLIPPFYAEEGGAEGTATVGDWLLLDNETFEPSRLLTRKSLFKRRAAGVERKAQLIAANVDTLFIVSSCNQDFNFSRLERYLILALEAGVTPVIVLTKADLTGDSADYAAKARKLHSGIVVETVDALDPASVASLNAWCERGQTVALLGSSGVGKSTLVNTLAGTETAITQGIRQGDDKGRHTTTGRTFHQLPNGGWLLDTPGMRELQLTDVAAGIDHVFADISALTAQCHFNNCAHKTEPKCAVRAAIEDGTLDETRFKRWQKLSTEEAFNTESLHERNARNRKFGRIVKTAQQKKQKNRPK